MKDWLHIQDSLNYWNISNEKESAQMKWVLAKFSGRSIETNTLAKIAGQGKESVFHLFLQAIDLIEGKGRHNEAHILWK